MRNRAFITQITDDEIYALQLVTDACAECTGNCIYRGTPFLVTNKKNLPIEKGSTVYIGMSRLRHAVHAFTSLP